MNRRIPLLVLLAVLVFVAAFTSSTLFCYADTQQDVDTVRAILADLAAIEADPEGGAERFAVSTVWQYMLTLDKMRADTAVWGSLTQDEKQEADRFHRLYTRDSCLVKLHNHVQDHIYKVAGGEVRHYYDLEWDMVLALVDSYVAQIDEKSEAAMQADLADLFAAIEEVPSREALYADWSEIVEAQIRWADTKLFDRVDAMRYALGLSEAPRHLFVVSFTQDCLDSWDRYVADYVSDSEALVDFYHTAYQATVDSDVRTTQSQILALWQGYEALVNQVKAVNVSSDDALLLAEKAALRDYVAHALQTEPIASYTGEKWQYYADLAMQCDLDLDQAVTLQDVAVISDNYRPLFVVKVEQDKKDNTQWWVLGVSLAVALVCFVVYFILKKRNPTVKTERQSAEQFLAELQNMGKQNSDAANVPCANEEQSPLRKEAGPADQLPEREQPQQDQSASQEPSEQDVQSALQEASGQEPTSTIEQDSLREGEADVEAPIDEQKVAPDGLPDSESKGENHD